MTEHRYLYVVVGGGISGICCVKELARLFPEKQHQILLITGSSLVSESNIIVRHSEFLEEIEVYEQTSESFQFDNPNIEVFKDFVNHLDTTNKRLILKGGKIVYFEKLCLCTGVRPRLIAEHPNIIGIRDLESVENLVQKLRDAKRIIIVGNGGIALELIHEMKQYQIDWIVKDNYIGSAFFDSTASAFITPILQAKAIIPPPTSSSSSSSNQHITTSEDLLGTSNEIQTNKGYGLGPEWLKKTNFRDKIADLPPTSYHLNIHYEEEVIAISDSLGRSWNIVNEQLLTYPLPSFNEVQTKLSTEDIQSCKLLVYTSKSDLIPCDFIVSATGVMPNTDFLRQSNITSNTIACDEEGYILVNDTFQSLSHPDVYAAGDCCHYQPRNRSTELFFQMKLWTQARIMGMYVAQCMAGVEEDYGLDSHLELFSHITRFFGYKVVLLGRYNAQGFGKDIEDTVKMSTVIVKGEEVEFQVDSPGDQGKNQTVQNQSKGSKSSFELWVRINPGKEYIKLVIYEGRVIGCLLIGNTDLEEVFENLILNRLNISSIGIRLLDPMIDIGDYFD
eukprot:gene12694-13901_t